MCQRKTIGQLSVHQAWEMWVPQKIYKYINKYIQFLAYILDEHVVEMKYQSRSSNMFAVTTDLQRFLGFTNLYQWFIRGFSFMATTLTPLLNGKPYNLHWTDETLQAFQKLKPELLPRFTGLHDASKLQHSSILKHEKSFIPWLRWIHQVSVHPSERGRFFFLPTLQITRVIERTPQIQQNILLKSILNSTENLKTSRLSCIRLLYILLYMLT